MSAVKPAPAIGSNIVHVAPRSKAAQVGMVAGDRLLKINRHEINDVLDYWFHGAGNKLNVEWQSAAGPRPR